MATRPATITYPGQNVRVAWDTLTEADEGVGVAIADYSDKTVQVVGSFGTGGSVAIEGSNDGGTTWSALHDPQGTVIAITAAGMELIAENPLLIRPNITAGTTVDVDVFINGVKVL